MINKYALKFWPCRCIGTWWSLNSNPVVSYCNVNDIMSTFKISANVNYHGIWCVVFVCALYVVYLSHVHVSCINNHGIRNHGFPLESKWIFVLFPWNIPTRNSCASSCCPSWWHKTCDKVAMDALYIYL